VHNIIIHLPQATQGQGKPKQKQFHLSCYTNTCPVPSFLFPPFHSAPSRTSPVKTTPLQPPNPNLSAGARFKCAGSAPPHAADEPRRARRRGRRPLRRQPQGLAPRHRLLGVHRRQLHRQEEGPPPRRRRGRPSRYL
jgi:hypothetical protein